LESKKVEDRSWESKRRRTSLERKTSVEQDAEVCGDQDKELDALNK
jgi:hypothetical protein